MEDRCPECGEPLERADDFWYCDNPRCPRRQRASDDAVAEAEPQRQPGSEPAK